MKNFIFFLFGFLTAAVLGVGLYYFNMKKQCNNENFAQVDVATAQKYADSFKKDFPKVRSEFYVSKDFIYTGKKALYSLKNGDRERIYGFKISYGLIEAEDSIRVVSLLYPIIQYDEMLSVDSVFFTYLGKIDRKALPCPPFCDVMKQGSDAE